MQVTSPIIRMLVGLFSLAILVEAQSAQDLQPAAYEHIFRHINFIKNRTAVLISQKKLSNLPNYYKDLAGLTQTESDALQTVAINAVVELDALDQQAKAIIVQIRAGLKPGQKLSSPPGQLVALQALRNSSIANSHGKLAQAIGPIALKRLEQAILLSKNGATKKP